MSLVKFCICAYSVSKICDSIISECVLQIVMNWLWQLGMLMGLQFRRSQEFFPFPGNFFWEIIKECVLRTQYGNIVNCVVTYIVSVRGRTVRLAAALSHSPPHLTYTLPQWLLHLICKDLSFIFFYFIGIAHKTLIRSACFLISLYS